MSKVPLGRVQANGPYDLAALGDSRALLTQRREAPEGVPELATSFVENHLGAASTFMPAVADGGRETREALKGLFNSESA